MVAMLYRRGSGLLAAQFALVAALLIAIMLAPPARGALWLIPLTPMAAHRIVAMIGPETPLIGTGPLPGSLIVQGDRAALSNHLAWRGVLLIAAPPAGCIRPRAGGRA